ncbi:MAG: hypothetical protein LIO69_02500 [Oscillospiraceae bacterium]|nr:hypothetical protein [Oscillospiraceae bacterium]
MSENIKSNGIYSYTYEYDKKIPNVQCENADEEPSFWSKLSVILLTIIPVVNIVFFITLICGMPVRKALKGLLTTHIAVLMFKAATWIASREAVAVIVKFVTDLFTGV